MRSPSDRAPRRAFVPAAILAAGAIATWSLPRPHPVPLARPLTELPSRLADIPGSDVVIPEEQLRAAGVSAYLFRSYPIDSVQRASLYVGYYASQNGDAEMHTPVVCLPGSGWYPVAAGQATVLVDGRPVPVNRYVIEKGSNRALVYYWFQGRGRITADERVSRGHAFWDGIFRHRTDESLVRIVVPLGRGTPSTPVGPDGQPAERLAGAMAAAVMPALARLLPPSAL